MIETGTTTTTAPEVTTTAPAAPATTGDWTSGFSEDTRGYVQNKGFKDPASVVESYRNFEKLMGVPKERILKLPEKPDDPSWNEIYTKLGKPEKPEGYKVPSKDPEFAKWAQSTFHEAGLTEMQAAKVMEKWNGYVEGSTKTQQEAFQAKLNQEGEALKKEWGAAYEQNINQAKRAAKGLNIAPEVIDTLEKAMGFSGVMKLMQSLGSKLGEDSFVNGQKTNSFGVMTPEAAKNRIMALKTDGSFVQKYASGDLAAREEMTNLHKMAYPELN